MNDYDALIHFLSNFARACFVLAVVVAFGLVVGIMMGVL